MKEKMVTVKRIQTKLLLRTNMVAYMCTVVLLSRNKFYQIHLVHLMCMLPCVRSLV